MCDELTCSSRKEPHKHAVAHTDKAAASSSAMSALWALKKNQYMILKKRALLERATQKLYSRRTNEQVAPSLTSTFLLETKDKGTATF